jgi:hypothetical protein
VGSLYATTGRAVTLRVPKKTVRVSFSVDGRAHRASIAVR